MEASKTNDPLGLLAVLGVWLSAGFALPLVNVLRSVSPEQLLTVRGLITALFAFVLSKGQMRVDRYTYLIAPALGLASLGLFKGIRIWGAGPTLIIVAGTPILNFLVTIVSKKRVGREASIALALLLTGIIIANGKISWSNEGFAYSLFGTIWNAVLYELFARSQAKALQQCFWGTLGMGLVGLVLSFGSNWKMVFASSTLGLSLVSFALLGGLLYWLCNIWAFERLPKNATSVLLQGETPAVILMAWVLLGEPLTPSKIIGVTISLYGAWRLKQSLAANNS